MTEKKKQPEPAKPRDSTTSGNEGERLREDRPFMVEGKRYVRHPEDDATFLVSCMHAGQNIDYTAKNITGHIKPVNSNTGTITLILER